MKATLIDIPFTEQFHVKTVNQPFLNTPFHFHHYCELVYIEASTGQRIVGDCIENFSPGDLVFMGPNLPHIWHNDAVYHLRNRDQLLAKAIVVYFNPQLLHQFKIDSVAGSAPVVDLLEASGQGIQFIGSTRDTVYALLQQLKEKNGIRKWIVLLEILDLLCNSTDKRQLASLGYSHRLDEKDASRFNSVYQYLLHNFKRPITLDEVAQVANMSRSAFCRYFKSRTQKSVVDFINELRIGHACKLLTTEEKSIASICYECGFQNLSNFNRFFKHFTGRTPKAFRSHLLRSRL